MASKLIKVARDFNVGLHTIVEKLRDKGFHVEERPTTEITDDMMGVLNREFQKDLAIKQEADKLARPALKKEPVSPIVGASPAAPAAPIALAPPAPRPVLAPPREESVVVAAPPALPKIELQPPTQAKEQRDLPQRTVPGLRILGKIDLDAPRQSEKPVITPPQAESAKPEPAKPEPPQPTPAAPVVETPPQPAAVPAAPIRLAKPGEQPIVQRSSDRNDNRNNDNRNNDSRGNRPNQPQQGGGGQRPERSNDRNNQRSDRPNDRNNQRSDRPNDRDRNRDRDRGGRPQGNAPAPLRPPIPPPAPPKPVDLPPVVTTPEEPAEPFRADAPQLRGLKIMGRINLDTPKPETSGGRDRGGRDRNRGGQGGNRGGQGGNRGGQGQGGTNRPAQPGTGTGTTPGTGTAAGANDERRKRKRKKVPQQPVTAANLQTSMSNNQGDKKGRGRTNEPQAVSQKEIEDKIRQTMARLGAGASRKRQKIRRDKRDVMRERAEKAELAQNESEKTLQVTEFIAVSDLASLMSIRPADIIKSCMDLGIFVSINQRLDAEIIEVVAGEFGFAVQFISAEEQVEVEEEIIDDPKDLSERQPIVTVMGHVDHGKTSLLDFIRNANVASGEAGGITQHIGAYEVAVDSEGASRKITFLDTPGHEAFTAMRARGAKVTDIAIIVIAADDSIMPQTREAISHAQAASVPMIFAINKIDKPGADPERIKNELAQMNLMVEEWGGKYQSQDISAKKGQNIDKLLEKVLLEADLLELKANPKRRATGTVLEASLDKGRGYVTKILVENGTIEEGAPIIAGEFSGKVKAMFNERGKKIKSAGPAVPVLILGLPGAPQAGEKIKVAASEAEAKEIAAKRAQILREQNNRANKRISLDEIGRRLALGNFKELKLIVKGDVDGSIEALTDSMIKLSMEKIQVNVIHKAVGQIVDSDVMLASASDAIIIGFQVRPSITARKLAEKEGVEIKMYSIIYEAIEEIKAAMEGMLEPTKEEEIMGQVEIREVFKISKVGTVAGCYVQEGKISRNHYVRIIRDGIVVYPVNTGQNAELSSLKRFKEDAKEVKAGIECGMTIRNFNDIKVGDIVESYVINEVKAKL